MDPKIINYIKEHPKEADALASEWQEFIATSSRENPEVLDIKSKEELLAWAAQHPEKHIDTSIWVGKEITDFYFYLKRQQEDSRTQAQGDGDKKEERQGEGVKETPRESIKDIINRERNVSRPTSPSTTQQPQIQTPTRGFFNRGIGRGSARLGGRVAGRTGSMAGRLASRLAAQAGMMVGRTAVQGVVAGATAIGAVGWIVIAVIIVIIIIVFLIIMFAGGGGGIGGPAPTVDCADADGNPIVVFDGNECAVNTAAYYSNLTGTSITATCVDKCTDTVSVLCGRNATNNCTSPDASCGTMQTFCIQYSPAPLPSATWLYDCNSAIFDYTFFASCSGSGIITPTPTP